MKPRDLIDLFKQTGSEWSEDNASRLSAALAYYTVFSVAPLLVIIMAIAGFVFRGSEGRLMEQIGSFVGPQAASILQTMLENARRPGSGIVAGVIGIVVLIVGASGVFYELHSSLNTIWDVERKSEKGIMGVIRTRTSSFLVIFLIGFLLILALAASTAISTFGNLLAGTIPGMEYLLQAANFLLSFAVIGVLFAVLYKTLPDVDIRWSDVAVGAGVTSLLFVIGKLLIGLYLSKSTVASPYGAAGSLIILLAFVYYSAQIFFVGAEFTQIYANRYGSRLLPSEHAKAIPEEEPSAQEYPSRPPPEQKGETEREERRRKGAAAAHPRIDGKRPKPLARDVDAPRIVEPDTGDEEVAPHRWGFAFATFIGGLLAGMFLRRPARPA